jgi:hypothetical protein
VSDEPSATAPPDHQFEDRSRWLGPGLLAALVVVVVLALSIVPAYRWLKLQRGLRLATQAREALKAGNLPESLRLVRVAVGLAPKDPEISRVTAEICDTFGVPESLTYWGTVLASDTATLRDRQRYVTAALDHGRLDLARGELAGLVKTNETDLENLRLSIRLLEQRGDPVGAILAARRTTELHPTNDLPKLALATLLNGRPEPEARAEGRGQLWLLASRNGPARLDAIQILARDPTLGADDKMLLLAHLSGFGSDNVPARLSALRLRLELDPGSQAEILTDAARLASSSASSNSVNAALEWLTNLGAHEKLLQTMPMDRARNDPAWTFWHLSSLGALNRWQELRPLLDDPKLPLATYRRRGLQAAMDRAQGDTNAARVNLDNAISEARTLPDELQRLGVLSERLGEPEVAMRAWSGLLDFPPLARRAALQVLRLSDRGDNPEMVVLAAKRLLSFDPKDVLALNELAHTLFIDGRRDAAIERQLEAETSAAGAQPGLVVTLALLRLQTNRGAEALDLLEGRGIDWKNAPPRWRLIYAAALAANQQREGAKRIWAGIDPGRLKSAEREFARNRF